MTIETLPFEHLPRNSIANNIDKINELVDWANQHDRLSTSATGESVTVDDASSLKELQVYGKSVQDGTPTPDAPVPVETVGGKNLLTTPYAMGLPYTHRGVTYSDAGNGGITVSGTAQNGDSYVSIMQYNSTNNKLVVGGTYTLSTGSSNVKSRYYSPSRGTSTNTSVTLEILDEHWMMILCVPYGTTVSETIYPQIEAGSTATPYVPYGSIGIDIGGTATPIDLQGNTLASLPDGTRDELQVDSAGHCVLTKNVGEYVITGQEAGSTSQLGDYYRFYSNVVEDMQAPLQVTQGDINGYCTHSRYAVEYGGQYVHAYVIQGKKFLVYSTNETPLSEFVGAELYYPLATTQTIDLGYIDPPAIPGGSVVTISASLTPEFRLEWWVESGITDVIEDLKAYVDYKTEG